MGLFLSPSPPTGYRYTLRARVLGRPAPPTGEEEEGKEGELDGDFSLVGRSTALRPPKRRQRDEDCGSHEATASGKVTAKVPQLAGSKLIRSVDPAQASALAHLLAWTADTFPAELLLLSPDDRARWLVLQDTVVSVKTDLSENQALDAFSLFVQNQPVFQGAVCSLLASLTRTTATKEDFSAACKIGSGMSFYTAPPVSKAQFDALEVGGLIYGLFGGLYHREWSVNGRIVIAVQHGELEALSEPFMELFSQLKAVPGAVAFYPTALLSLFSFLGLETRVLREIGRMAGFADVGAMSRPGTWKPSSSTDIVDGNKGGWYTSGHYCVAVPWAAMVATYLLSATGGHRMQVFEMGNGGVSSKEARAVVMSLDGFTGVRNGKGADMLCVCLVCDHIEVTFIAAHIKVQGVYKARVWHKGEVTTYFSSVLGTVWRPPAPSISFDETTYEINSCGSSEAWKNAGWRLKSLPVHGGGFEESSVPWPPRRAPRPIREASAALAPAAPAIADAALPMEGVAADANAASPTEGVVGSLLRQQSRLNAGEQQRASEARFTQLSAALSFAEANSLRLASEAATSARAVREVSAELASLRHVLAAAEEKVAAVRADEEKAAGEGLAFASLQAQLAVAQQGEAVARAAFQQCSSLLDSTQEAALNSAAEAASATDALRAALLASQVESVGAHAEAASLLERLDALNEALRASREALVAEHNKAAGLSFALDSERVKREETQISVEQAMELIDALDVAAAAQDKQLHLLDAALHTERLALTAVRLRMSLQSNEALTAAAAHSATASDASAKLAASNLNLSEALREIEELKRRWLADQEAHAASKAAAEPLCLLLADSRRHYAAELQRTVMVTSDASRLREELETVREAFDGAEKRVRLAEERTLATETFLISICAQLELERLRFDRTDADAVERAIATLRATQAEQRENALWVGLRQAAIAARTSEAEEDVEEQEGWKEYMAAVPLTEAALAEALRMAENRRLELREASVGAPFACSPGSAVAELLSSPDGEEEEAFYGNGSDEQLPEPSDPAAPPPEDSAVAAAEPDAPSPMEVGEAEQLNAVEQPIPAGAAAAARALSPALELVLRLRLLPTLRASGATGIFDELLHMSFAECIASRTVVFPLGAGKTKKGVAKVVATALISKLADGFDNASLWGTNDAGSVTNRVYNNKVFSTEYTQYEA